MSSRVDETKEKARSALCSNGLCLLRRPALAVFIGLFVRARKLNIKSAQVSVCTRMTLLSTAIEKTLS